MRQRPCAGITDRNYGVVDSHTYIRPLHNEKRWKYQSYRSRQATPFPPNSLCRIDEALARRHLTSGRIVPGRTGAVDIVQAESPEGEVGPDGENHGECRGDHDRDEVQRPEDRFNPVDAILREVDDESIKHSPHG